LRERKTTLINNRRQLQHAQIKTKKEKFVEIKQKTNTIKRNERGAKGKNKIKRLIIFSKVKKKRKVFFFSITR
jgi:hypothetical protein